MGSMNILKSWIEANHITRERGLYHWKWNLSSQKEGKADEDGFMLPKWSYLVYNVHWCFNDVSYLIHHQNIV